MSTASWLVVLYWLGPNSSEYTQSVAFATYEEARAEIRRLTDTVGTVAGGRLLKSVALVGDYQALWGRPA